MHIFFNNYKTIAYRGESKNGIQFFCFSDFQSHHPLNLLLLYVNDIQLQRISKNIHGLTIKMQRILGLKLVQIQLQIFMTCA